MKRTTKLLILSLFLAAGAFVGHANAAAASKGIFKRDLHLRDRGSDVIALQNILIKKRYLKISAPTGYFGMQTKIALAAWQKRSGIAPASGYFGPISKIKIAASVSASGTSQAAPIAIGVPVSIIIPKLGVNAAIRENGLTPDGALDAPKNIYDVGWYNASPMPGAHGSAVFVGHVAQIRGGVVTKQGVFFDIGLLRKGDIIEVKNSKGGIVRFAVREIRVYDPAASAAEVFRSDGIHLNLITCEGTWSPSKQSYSSRLVVFADIAK